MKVIEIEERGYVWQVPLVEIAKNRAAFYADGDLDIELHEIDYVMNDDAEGLDWFKNNMDFEDVEQFAVLVSEPENKTPVPDCNSYMEIIEIDADYLTP